MPPTAKLAPAPRESVTLAFGSAPDAGVVFANLKYSITNHQGDRTEILHHGSGNVRPGEVLAMMGASGAGKTTLLNLLAGRTVPDSGLLTVNGEELSKPIRRRCSYVAQEDKLMSNLTVRETIQFAATLRLPEHVPMKSKLERVEQVIDELGLQACANTIIGSVTRRGVSGGEKKRTAIAVELVASPSVLLMDEPTTGLDSKTALNLITTLRTLAKQERCAIIISIHQPSSQIWAKFDKVLLMTRGYSVFCGPQRDVLPYIETTAGQKCGEHFNPADFLLDVLSDTECSKQLCEAVGRQKATLCVQCGIPLPADAENAWCDECQPHKSRRSTEILDLAGLPAPRFPTSWWTQFRTLCRRAFKQALPEFFHWLNWFQTLALAVLLSLVWFQMDHSEESVQDRVGLIFFLVVYWGFNVSFSAVQAFFANRDIILKERIAGTYSLSAYVAATSISELPLAIVLPSVCYIITYWATGLRGGEYFVYSWLVAIVEVLSVQAVGFFIGCAVTDFKKAMLAIQLFILGSMLVGGFYAQKLPSWFTWIRWSSFVKYCWDAQLTLEFRGADNFVCDHPSRTEYEICRNATTSAMGISGTEILDRRDIYQDLGLLVPVLAVYGLFFRVLAYLSLRYINGTHARVQV